MEKLLFIHGRSMQWNGVFQNHCTEAFYVRVSIHSDFHGTVQSVFWSYFVIHLR